MRSKAVRRVTLQDIARETGYSVNTVSHALRGMPDIADATAKRIREVARDMGYTPNQLASSLRSGRTRVIAVILGDMSNPFYGIITDTIQNFAMKLGYTLMIMCSRDDPELEYNLVEQAIARRADGILLFPNIHSQGTIQYLKSANVPFVLMFRYLERGQADSVVCDEETGAYLATRHLMEHGLRRLAYISGDKVVYSSECRKHGFLRACREANLDPAEYRVCEPDSAASPWEPNRVFPEVLLELKRDGFDGLFVFCDVEAWRAMYALQNTPGLEPGDFGIVSFDNIEGVLSFPVPLCSIDCNYPEMARRGLELLLGRINGDTRQPQTVVCPVELVCRESCRQG